MPASLAHQQSSSNEEWPEIVGRPVGPLTTSNYHTRKINMTTSKPTKVMSFNKRMSAEDLTSLKKQDAFAYYSIPGIRSAKMLLKEVDESTNLDDCQLTRNCVSSPSRLETSQPGKVTFKRSSCISFECHPDLILFDDIEEEDSDDDDFSDDEFESMLIRLSLNKVVQ